MKTIDDVRDYLQTVIEELEGMADSAFLDINVSELKREASRLSSIITRRDNFNDNVKVLDPIYKGSRDGLYMAVNNALAFDHEYDDWCSEWHTLKDLTPDDTMGDWSRSLAGGCGCYQCWSYDNRYEYDFRTFSAFFYGGGFVNDLVVQHYNMMLIKKDENSTTEQLALAETQRALTIIIAKQRFLKMENEFNQQKIKDYETSKQ